MPTSGTAAPDGTGTVGALGEQALIARIRARVPPSPPSVIVGIGDDAAVIEGERNTLTVLTTDGLIEGVHFSRASSAPCDIGHKALAVNLSDLASMGAAPRLALLALALPADLPLAHLDGLVEGLLDLARAHKVSLVGGNIARTPGPLTIDVTAVGSVHRRRVLTRAGARPGDDVYVSGSIGGAAAGLEWLRAHTDGGPAVEAGGDMTACVERQRRPEPRVRLGRLLGQNRAASSCVDLSDGLADGIARLAEASGVGAVLDRDLVPLDPAARRWFERREGDAVRRALAGGEDYELLWTAPRRSHRRVDAVRRLARGVAVTRIGTVTAERALILRVDGRDDTLPRGFTHFGTVPDP